MGLAERVTELERQLALRDEENAALRAMVGALEAELERLRREQSKDSANSGKPPSSGTLTQRPVRRPAR